MISRRSPLLSIHYNFRQGLHYRTDGNDLSKLYREQTQVSGPHSGPSFWARNLDCPQGERTSFLGIFGLFPSRASGKACFSSVSTLEPWKMLDSKCARPDYP